MNKFIDEVERCMFLIAENLNCFEAFTRNKNIEKDLFIPMFHFIIVFTKMKL